MVGDSRKRDSLNDQTQILSRPGEVAKTLGIASSTLRSWSRAFADYLTIPARSRGLEDHSHRRYSNPDILLLARLKELLGEGMTFEEVRRQLDADVSNVSYTALTPRMDEGNVQTNEELEELPVLQALRARLPTLSRKQFQLAQVVLNSPELVMFGSVRELASQLDVNNATIIRFAQSLGFSGYQAMQAALRQFHLPRAGLQPPRDMRAKNDADGVLNGIFTQWQTNLTLAQQYLAKTDLSEIGEVLLRARRILVAANGSSIVPATLFVRLLRHVGIRGELVSMADVDRELCLFDVASGDVMIGIGFWLTFRGVVDTLQLGRKLGATTIVIAGSPTSQLAQVADYLIIAPAQGTSFSFSCVATIAVIEAIISHIALLRPQRTEAIAERLHDLYLEEGLLAPLHLPSKRWNG